MSRLDAARAMHSVRRRDVIKAEEALDAAIKLRDEAEEAMIRAEEEDDCCGVCP